MADYLYISPQMDAVAVFSSSALVETTERHNLVLDVGPLRSTVHPLAELDGPHPVSGVVLALRAGLPDRTRLRFVGAALRRHLRVWLYWPDERAVECVDEERLRSLWHHRIADSLLHRVGRPLSDAITSYRRLRPGLRWIYRGAFPVRRYDILDELNRLILAARPVPMQFLEALPSPAARMRGAGLYFRADFWATNISGGSYGHTCYVAKELAAVSADFVCLMTQRFSLLDDLGVRQVVMPSPSILGNEDAIATAPAHFYPIARAVCEAIGPAYIYTRLSLGNSVPAQLSRDLQIPLIVEYNGSEISMQRSFDARAPYFYEDIYLKAEELAFCQASVVSVISTQVKSDLVGRGVDAAKILVNPNGADLVSYAPADPEEKAQIRRSLGCSDADRIVGFTGTFGGWHGIDVLAAAIPRVCAALPQAKFLVIGDGSHKPLLDAAVSTAGLDERVIRVGRVPQSEGARLLKACDIYVSPHNSHMVDSPFFGSPTKIFEYMALGGGIVASDLEQIGEVLAPALRATALTQPASSVTHERAVLCTPGDVDEFVDAVVHLIERPEIGAALGRNARQAVVDHYSWTKHVERLWAFALERRQVTARRLETGDQYKEQIQNQWNANPVGSEAARAVQPHTLEWFLEIERDRYGTYAPWMPSVMEFSDHAGEAVLEIGGGVGTDLAQFAKHGARVTDLDLSHGHLQLAEENFRLRGLTGTFVHHDAEILPFEDAAFDLVYSNGVLHHTPNTARAIDEVFRVLKPGGRVIAMLYAEDSLQYWRNLVWAYGIRDGQLSRASMADILSRTVERTSNESRPLTKVYTRTRVNRMFRKFTGRQILQRQLSPEIVPRPFRRLAPIIERVAGWNLIIKATKPRG